MQTADECRIKTVTNIRFAIAMFCATILCGLAAKLCFAIHYPIIGWFLIFCALATLLACAGLSHDARKYTRLSRESCDTSAIGEPHS